MLVTPDGLVTPDLLVVALGPAVAVGCALTVAWPDGPIALAGGEDGDDRDSALTRWPSATWRSSPAGASGAGGLATP